MRLHYMRNFYWDFLRWPGKWNGSEGIQSRCVDLCLYCHWFRWVLMLYRCEAMFLALSSFATSILKLCPSFITTRWALITFLFQHRTELLVIDEFAQCRVTGYVIITEEYLMLTLYVRPWINFEKFVCCTLPSLPFFRCLMISSGEFPSQSLISGAALTGPTFLSSALNETSNIKIIAVRCSDV